MNEYRDQMANMQDAWDAAAEGEAFDSIPPGLYTCRLVSAELGTNSNEGLQVVVQFAVCEGEHVNETITDWQQLSTEQGPRFFRLFVETMGFEFPSKPDEVENLCAQMSQAKPGCTVKVTKQKDSNYNRIRVTGRVSDDQLPDIVGVGDDIPYEAPSTAATEEPNPDVPEQSDQRADLDAFCLANEIEVNDAMSDADVIKEICAFDYPNVEEFTPQELALLRTIGALPAEEEKPKSKAKAKKKQPKTPEFDWDAALVDLARQNDIKVGRRTVAEIVKEMANDYDWSDTKDEDDLKVLRHFNIIK